MQTNLVEIISPAPLSLLEVIDQDIVEVVRDAGTSVVEVLGVGLQGAQGPMPPVTKGLTLIDPNSTENFSVFYTADQITLDCVSAMVTGDPEASVTFSLLFGPDRNSGTEIVTGGTTVLEDPSGVVIDSLDEPVIPAASWVWLEVTNTTGFVTEFHVSVTH